MSWVSLSFWIRKQTFWKADLRPQMTKYKAHPINQLHRQTLPIDHYIPLSQIPAPHSTPRSLCQSFMSCVPALRITGTGEPGGLPSIGSHRVWHNWSNLAAAAAGHMWLFSPLVSFSLFFFFLFIFYWRIIALQNFAVVMWLLFIIFGLLSA